MEGFHYRSRPRRHYWLQYIIFRYPVSLEAGAGTTPCTIPLPGKINQCVEHPIHSDFALFDLLDQKTNWRNTRFLSQTLGSQRSNDTVLAGRIQLDVYRYAHSELKVSNYKLDTVCNEILGKDERKEDVPWTAIAGLQAGTSKDRQRLAIYCLKVSTVYPNYSATLANCDPDCRMHTFRKEFWIKSMALCITPNSLGSLGCLSTIC
jgi:hypothetical protein